MFLVFLVALAFRVAWTRFKTRLIIARTAAGTLATTMDNETSFKGHH